MKVDQDVNALTIIPELNLPSIDVKKEIDTICIEGAKTCPALFNYLRKTKIIVDKINILKEELND